MLKIPVPDHIDFLVKRKFPELRGPTPPMVKKYGFTNGIVEDPYDDQPAQPSEDTLKKAAVYRQKLEALAKPEVKQLYKEELEKHHEESDQRRFFNQSDAEADFDYWSKIPGWKVDEAIALTLNKNPKIVNPERLKEVLNYTSPFVQKYNEIRELVSRTRSAGLFTDSTIVTHTDHIIPHKYVQWAQNADIGFPKELADKVLRFHEANKPPKTALEKTLENLERRGRKNPIDIGKEQIEMVLKRKGPLTQKAEGLSKGNSSQSKKTAKPRPKAAYTKEQETLMKLIIGMAVDGYGYNPEASRSPFPKELEGILNQLGISVSDDTVRKWLKESSELLPQSHRNLDD